MSLKSFSTAGHILVCKSQNCQVRGSDLLYQALWNHLERESLAYYKKGGNLRLTESGCLGACSFGPTLCVYRERNKQLEEGWYASVDFPLAKKIMVAVHNYEDLPTAHKYGPEESL